LPMLLMVQSHDFNLPYPIWGFLQIFDYWLQEWTNSI